MKKILAILLAATLLVACGGSGSTDGGSYKLGVASTQGAKVSDDKDKATYNTVVVAVALEDDKITYVEIDESQQVAEIADGKVTMDTSKTKKQLGDDYGMKSDHGSDFAEWDEQIENLQKALIGKTKDEVVAYIGSEDVKTAATIQLGQIEETIVKAIDQAVAVEGVAKVGLGYNVSTDADDEGTQTVLDYAFVGVDADGKIVSALLDSAQEKVDVKDGALVAKNINKTKGELKDDYGMATIDPSSLAEWNVQNDSLMAALVGKTLDEAAGLVPNEGDLASKVTIVIEDYLAALENAKAALVNVK